MRRYVIIGSGAAGVAAAETIRTLDPTGKIWILTGDPHGYYSRPGLAYWLSGEVPESQLYPYPNEYLRGLNLQWHVEPVTDIRPDAHLVDLKNGKSLPYDRLLIATGATAMMPDAPGINLDGVVKLDSWEDTQHILQRARRGQTAVVVGGGITALELVEGLAARGMRVHYFLRGDRYWSGVLDPTESQLVEERLSEDGVIVHHNTNLLEVLGSGGRVKGVIVQEGDRSYQLDCRLVAAAIGIRPRIELAARAGLGVRRGILATALLQTNDQDIFAAGDVAEILDPISGKALLDSLWKPAMKMGCVAGSNMAGISARYTKLSPFNVTRLAGLVTTIIGQVASQPEAGAKDRDLPGVIMRGDSEVWRLMPEAVVAQSYREGSRLRLYIRQNYFAGAVIMGDQTLSRPMEQMIRVQTDISAIREALLAPEAALIDILSPFIQENQNSYAVKVA
jgi:nitrite reductase (NADH) large subunit